MAISLDVAASDFGKGGRYRLAAESRELDSDGMIELLRGWISRYPAIVHLAIGWGARQLKVGSFTRSERMAKWNEGLRIAEALGDATLPPRSAFPWGRA